MNFIYIEENGSYSTSLPMTLLSNILKKVDNTGNKTLDDLMDKYIVVADNATFETEDSTKVVNGKKMSFMVLESNQTASVTINKEKFNILIPTSGEAIVSKEPIDPKLVIDYSAPYDEKSDEYAAIKWVEGLNTGASSISLLVILYPHIKHPKLDNVDQISLPQDAADFNRCYEFIKAVPGAKEKLFNDEFISKKLPQWNDLITNWVDLTEKLEAGEYKEVSNYIHQINTTRRKPLVP